VPSLGCILYKSDSITKKLRKHSDPWHQKKHLKTDSQRSWMLPHLMPATFRAPVMAFRALTSLVAVAEFGDVTLWE